MPKKIRKQSKPYRFGGTLLTPSKSLLKKLALGGTLNDPPTTLSDSEIDKIKQFEVDTLKSPKFKQRFKGDVDEFLDKAITRTENINIVQDQLPGGKVGAGFMPRANKVMIDPAIQAKRGNNLQEVLSHEIGHVSNPTTFDPQTFDKLISSNKNFTDAQKTNLLNAANKTANSRSIMNKAISASPQHDRAPTEVRSNIQSLRFQLKDAGIFNDHDPNSTFTRETLEAARSNFKDSKVLERLENEFDEETLIQLMNEVADTGVNSDVTRTANTGGNLNFGQKLDGGLAGIGGMAGLSSILGMANQIIPDQGTQDPLVNNVGKRPGDILKTVGALGSAIPGIGGLIGAGVGLVGSGLNAFGVGEKKDEPVIPTVRNSSRFRMGGALNSDSFKVEGEGGIDKNLFKIKGQNVALTKGETVDLSGDRVISNEFEIEGKPLSAIDAKFKRARGKAEDMLKFNPNDPHARNSINRIRSSEDNLFQHQEALAAKLGLRTNKTQFKQTGGPLDPPVDENGIPILPEAVVTAKRPANLLPEAVVTPTTFQPDLSSITPAAVRDNAQQNPLTQFGFQNLTGRDAPISSFLAPGAVPSTQQTNRVSTGVSPENLSQIGSVPGGSAPFQNRSGFDAPISTFLNPNASPSNDQVRRDGTRVSNNLLEQVGSRKQAKPSRDPVRSILNAGATNPLPGSRQGGGVGQSGNPAAPSTSTRRTSNAGASKPARQAINVPSIDTPLNRIVGENRFITPQTNIPSIGQAGNNIPTSAGTRESAIAAINEKLGEGAAEAALTEAGVDLGNLGISTGDKIALGAKGAELLGKAALAFQPVERESALFDTTNIRETDFSPSNALAQIDRAERTAQDQLRNSRSSNAVRAGLQQLAVNTGQSRAQAVERSKQLQAAETARVDAARSNRSRFNIQSALQNRINNQQNKAAKLNDINTLLTSVGNTGVAVQQTLNQNKRDNLAIQTLAEIFPDVSKDILEKFISTSNSSRKTAGKKKKR